MNFICKLVVFILLVLSCSTAALAEDVPRFEVVSYQVEGNSILPAAEVLLLLAPFTGKDRDFGSLQQAVEALEKAFQSRGFHAVRVLLPEQELKSGVVRIAVYEARIGAVTIEGNKHFDTKNIRAAVPELKESAVPNLDYISRNIRVANENPARKMQLLLQNGEDYKSLNALLKVVDEKPWKVGLSLDDTGNDQTGNLRMGFSIQHANLFNLDHLATFQYTISPEKVDKVGIYTLGYRIPLYSWGDSIDFYGGYSDVDSGAVQSGILSLNVSGKGIFTGFRYNQNLTRIGAFEHRILYGFDYRRFENNVDYLGSPYGTITEVMPLSIGYAASFAFGRGSELSGWTSLSQNLPFGDKGGTNDFRKARDGAFGETTILRGGATLFYALPADVQARATLAAQYSWMPLIQGEQFGMGGQGSIRGFGEREMADDIGVAGSVEIYSPNIFKYLAVPKSQLRALAFYDAGYLEKNKPLAGETAYRNAASTGVGLRLAIDKYISASTDYAIVVGPQGNRSSGSARWHFKVNFMY
jgi:hemolysin activation/secretion protein